MDITGRVSAIFDKGDNVCHFMFLFFGTPIEKGSIRRAENLLPKGRGANSLLLEQTPIQRGDKTVVSCLPLKYIIYHKNPAFLLFRSRDNV